MVDNGPEAGPVGQRQVLVSEGGGMHEVQGRSRSHGVVSAAADELAGRDAQRRCRVSWG